MMGVEMIFFSISALNNKIESMKNIINTLKKVVPIVYKDSKKILIIIATLKVCTALTPAIQIYITKLLVDNINLLIVDSHKHFYKVLSIIIFQTILMILNLVMNSQLKYWNQYLSQLNTFKVKELIAFKSINLPLLFYEQSESYNILFKSMHGVRMFGILNTVFDFIQSCITAISIMIVIISFHWSLGLGILLLTIPISIIKFKIGKMIYSQAIMQTVNSRKEEYFFNLLHNRDAIKEQKVFNIGMHFFNNWKDIYWKNSNEKLMMSKKTNNIQLVTDSLIQLLTFLFMFFLLLLCASGDLTVGEYIALTLGVGSAQGAIKSIASQLSSLYECTLYGNELFNLLDVPEEKNMINEVHFPKPLKDGISVNQLNFSYPNSQNAILKNISFNIQPGEHIAIVGENGAGKTTLIKCLLGLYEVERNMIFFDGVDINDINSSDLRRNISVVFQDFFKYELTVKENIAIGDLSKKDNIGDILMEVSTKTGVVEIVNNLPQKFETQIGHKFDGAHELSYGQWQRISMARSVYKDAQLIILDEPTASLDPLSEVEIFRQFSKITENKISLTISHRLGSCKFADKILVLKDGELIEQGSHEELINIKGEYEKMYSVQAEWYQN